MAKESLSMTKGGPSMAKGSKDAIRQVAGGFSWLFFPFLSSLSLFGSLFCIYRALCWSNDGLTWIYRLAIVAYGIWFWWDWETPYCGRSRRSRWLIRWLRPLLGACIDYFSSTLILDFDYEAVKSTIEGHSAAFCCHPHGILSVGILSNFGITGGTQIFDKPVNVLTLNVQFYVPLWREFCIAMGCSSVSREGVEAMLRNGEDFVIVLGGARESLDSHSDRMELTIRARTGFFRLALKHRAAIFPTLTFGELDLYHQIQSPTLKRIQHRLLDFMSVAMPIFYGRYGIVPAARPLTTVIGEPVLIERPIESPSMEDIRALQERYIQALSLLHKKHAHRYQTHGRSCPLLVK